MNTKTCLGCKIEKPLFSFAYSNRARNGDNLSYFCRECSTTITAKERNRLLVKEWRKNNKAHQRRNADKSHTKSAESIAMGQYEAQLATQNGVCALCGDEGKEGRLHFDHRHKTGKKAKLLCNGCKAGLSGFKDDLGLLRKAILYLQENR